MLTEIRIDGFKSLQRVTVPLGLVNVFIGANGSGKSNLLEALGFLSAAAGGVLDDQALLRRGVRLGPRASYRSAFRKPEAPDKIQIRAVADAPDQGRVEHAVAISYGNGDSWTCLEDRFLFDEKGERRYHGGRIVSNQESILRLRERPGEYQRMQTPEAVLLTTETLADYGIFAPTSPVLRGNETDMAQREPVGLSGGRLAEAVKGLLKPRSKHFGSLRMDELLELLDWVDQIAVVPASRELVSASVPTLSEVIRFTDRWMARGQSHLSAYTASEGALYVLFALVLALHPKAPRLFAIENLDQNMHPRLARATVRLFCELMLKARPE